MVYLLPFALLCVLYTASALAPQNPISRRRILEIAGGISLVVLAPPSTAEETDLAQAVEVVATGDARKLFNEGRALESQGNMAAAQRIYTKVTKVSPRFIYGWSNLANTEVAFGDLTSAEENYSKAIDLCKESIGDGEEKFGVPRCSDMYVLRLNRGTVRLNNDMPKEALKDLQQASILRERPDAIILQNLARANEVNGLYNQADKDYNLAISMTANEVSPFWLRSAIVKFQVGNTKEGFDILKRVENRFPEAPEVRAAYAIFLAANGDQIAAQRKFLEIPDRQRLRYSDSNYLVKVISWPPAMIDAISKLAQAIGDDKRKIE